MKIGKLFLLKVASIIMVFLLAACGGEGTSKQTQTDSKLSSEEKVDFPTQSISLVIGYPPGGSTEPSGRAIAKYLGDELGVNITLDPKPGSLQAIASGYVLDQKSDGHTLFLRPQADYITGWILDSERRKDKPEDFITIGGTAENPYLVAVGKDAPWDSFEELIEDAKANPESISYSSSGVNSLHHITGSILEKEAGIKLNHVPYNGGGPATEALIKGDVDLHFTSIGKIQDYLETGHLKVLAVLDGERFDQLPDVPTASEVGFEVHAKVWHDIVVKNDTPSEVVEILKESFKKITELEEYKETLKNINFQPTYISPEEVEKRWADERELYTQTMKEIGAIK